MLSTFKEIHIYNRTGPENSSDDDSWGTEALCIAFLRASFEFVAEMTFEL